MSGSCGLSEGKGLFYSVSIENASAVENFYTPNDAGGTALAKLDRASTLDSGGIPAEAVALGTGSGGSSKCAGGAGLRPDPQGDDICREEGYNPAWDEKYRK